MRGRIVEMGGWGSESPLDHSDPHADRRFAVELLVRFISYVQTNYFYFFCYYTVQFSFRDIFVRVSYNYVGKK